MYSVFLFLLTMPKNKTSFYFHFFKLFKMGLRIFAGWLNSSAHVESEHSELQGLMWTMSCAGTSSQRSKRAVERAGTDLH